MTCLAAMLLIALFSPRRPDSHRGRYDDVLCTPIPPPRGVVIELTNGNLGQVLQTNDGICGFVTHGVDELGGYTTGTPILVTSMTDVANAGITAANNPYAIKNLTEFYTQAGNGAQLYVMLLPVTMSISDIADKMNPLGAVVLLNYAAGKIKVLGLLSDDVAYVAGGGTITTVGGINDDVYTAVTNAQALATTYAGNEWPLRVIIGGTSYDGTPGDLTIMNHGTTDNRVAIFIGDTEDSGGYSEGEGACVGLVLGMVSSIPVQRKISRVKNGPLTNTAAYLGVNPIESVSGQPALIKENGFITFWTYPNVSGYFFSGDDMCTATTDDYCFLCRGRVIDKAQIIAYTTFIQDVDDEIPTAPGGLIDPGYAANLQNSIEQQINIAMVANGNCSSVTCFVDPSQNVISTSFVLVSLSIEPEAYASLIEVELGFTL